MCIEKFDTTTHKWIPIDETDKIGTVQGIGATWIKNLRVTINGRETFNSNSLYAYKSYLDMELSYNNDVKRTYLSAAGYHPMSVTQYNQNATNDQYDASKKMFAEGHVAQF